MPFPGIEPRQNQRTEVFCRGRGTLSGVVFSVSLAIYYISAATTPHFLHSSCQFRADRRLEVLPRPVPISTTVQSPLSAPVPPYVVLATAPCSASMDSARFSTIFNEVLRHPVPIPTTVQSPLSAPVPPYIAERRCVVLATAPCSASMDSEGFSMYDHVLLLVVVVLCLLGYVVYEVMY